MLNSSLVGLWPAGRSSANSGDPRYITSCRACRLHHRAMGTPDTYSFSRRRPKACRGMLTNGASEIACSRRLLPIVTLRTLQNELHVCFGSEADVPPHLRVGLHGNRVRLPAESRQFATHHCRDHKSPCASGKSGADGAERRQRVS
jgi:hypothetical protein